MKVFVKNRKRVSMRFRSLLLVAALTISIQPGPAFAAGGTGSEAGLGVAAALCSLVYGPVKIVYATLGAVFGGMAWGLSGGDSEVMNAVVTPAVRGDYVVTPSILRGEEPLEFIGRRPGYEQGYEQDAVVVEDEFEETY
jgi:type IV secretory pathway VirB2 component (pilin)